MKCCADLHLLAAIACQLSECIDADNLALLAASLTALGDMLAVIAAREDLK